MEDCQDLKYKILIKNKKLKRQIKTEDAAEGEESANEGEEEEEEEDHQTKAKFWSPRKAGSKKKVSQGVFVFILFFPVSLKKKKEIIYKK